MKKWICSLQWQNNEGVAPPGGGQSPPVSMAQRIPEPEEDSGSSGGTRKSEPESPPDC